MTSGVVGTQRNRKRHVLLNKCSDFANIFKAFIGCNYLSMPFAFTQSGLLLGIIGLLIIAYITDHCCILIIKCKKATIDQIMNSTYACSYEEEQDEYRAIEKKKIKQKKNLELAITYGDLGSFAMGNWGIRIVNAALFVTQFSFCVNYFIFMGDTITRMFPLVENNQTHVANTTDNSTTSSSGSTEHNAPNEIFLMLIPFPLFLIQSYVRKVRSLGPLSAIANVCVFLGFFSILGFILKVIDFSNVKNVNLWNFESFPIFFGQTIGAFEGIGTIIPIEASMNENRKNFPFYLHGALALVTLILGSFGILGYISFAPDVKQLISDNLTYGVLSITVQVTLCIGILFTYPLQIFPIVEIIENFLFQETKQRSTLTASYHSEYTSIPPGSPPIQHRPVSQSSEEDTEDEDTEDEENGGDEEEMDSIGRGGYKLLVRKPSGLCSCDMGASTWKRNTVRTILVALSFAGAYVGRNYFAYIAALSGSIGSSLLAFILPCIFHLIIKRDKLSTAIVAKDILLILFGIIAGVVGFVTTLVKIIK